MDIASIEKLIAFSRSLRHWRTGNCRRGKSCHCHHQPDVVGPFADPAAVVQPQPAMPIPAAQALVIASDPATEHVTLSPMVGTFYLSGPGAPFVVVGQQVNAGDTLCI
jgi:acetyl-CoA carboxylase biotin carboxyl carrier protein